MTTPVIRIFVVDDHQVVRMGIKSMLESESDIKIVGTAASAAEALEILPSLEVDVVLTDLRLGGMTGAEMLVELRKVRPDIRATILSNYHSDEDVLTAMKAGAMAFVLKSAPMEQIVTAIRMANRGERFIPPQLAQQLAQQVGRMSLSARELEILQLVARGMKNREIADKLYISENTVRNHVISFLEKLGSRDRTEATSIAIRRGLVRLDED